MRSLKIGIIGASGLVGKELIDMLEKVPWCESIVPCVSEGSTVHHTPFRKTLVPMKIISAPELFSCDIIFFAATGTLSKEWAPRFAERGIIVIDKSSAWRLDAAVPLVIPEVNAHALRHHNNIIASPNCTTTGIVMALAPIHRHARITELSITTMQAASGGGKNGLYELDWQKEHGSEHIEPHVFPAIIANNIIPQCEEFLGNLECRTTTEEEKLIHETRKILDAPSMIISAFCTRVPITIGHSAVMRFQLEQTMAYTEIRSSLNGTPGLEYRDEHTATAHDVRGTDMVYVSRLRAISPNNSTSAFFAQSFWLWSVIDNIRKGAATNALHIANYLVEHNLM